MTIIYKITDNKKHSFYTVDGGKKETYKYKGYKTSTIIINNELLKEIEQAGQLCTSVCDYYERLEYIL